MTWSETKALPAGAGAGIAIEIRPSGEAACWALGDKTAVMFNRKEDRMEESCTFLFVGFDPPVATRDSDIKPAILADRPPDPVQLPKPDRRRGARKGCAPRSDRNRYEPRQA